MSEAPVSARFVDAFDPNPVEAEPWPTMLVTREEIDTQIERLTALDCPAGHVRRVLIAHPMASGTMPGFSPAIGVALEVTVPGETTPVRQHLGATLGFTIRGEVDLAVADVEMHGGLHDVWSIPSMAPYLYRNAGPSVHARLVYSTAPVLEHMGVAHMLNHPELDFLSYSQPRLPRPTDPLAEQVVQLASAAATIRSYEALVNPDLGDQRPALWTWNEVQQWLNPQAELGQAYTGRPVAVLAHAANSRVLGTTPTLSAMYGTMPPNFRMSPHRHSAASIVYHFGGSGHSVVGGRRVQWKAGDLMWGAPGMAIHFHASGDEQDLAMIVQDNALQLAMDNEFWQESLTEAPILIGSHDGYRTNRGALEAAR